MKDTKIYIAAHKKVELPNKEGYIPLQVGAALHDDLGYLKDSNGDNISLKNPNYCELTGLYYIWKNEKVDIIGLTHYRRYFFKNVFKTKLDDVLDINNINKILENNDIILPKKLYFSKTVSEQYKIIHNTDDLDKCGEIIKNIYTDYYDSYKKIVNKKYLYCYNMFIMKKELFDKYIEWLFNIFNELEKQVDLSKYDNYNKRIYGFLSERLFNVWIDKNKLKIKELPVYNIEEKTSVQIKNNIKNCANKVKGVLK